MNVAMVLALAFVLGPTCPDVTGDLFTGTWKLNLAKSNLRPPLPRSVTAYIECDGQSISVREETVDQNGQRHTESVRARFDGKQYPLVGSEQAETVVYERVDGRTIKGTSRKNGKVLVHETVVLSPDGMSFTATYSGANAEGQAVLGTAVFEKQLPEGAPSAAADAAPVPERVRGPNVGPTIEFDTKGVDFGPWIKRFTAQLNRNWLIPYAAMASKGHVVVTFYIMKDGIITQQAVPEPSKVEAFNEAAYKAVEKSNPTNPLPPEYPADRAFFTVTSYYNETPPKL